MKIPSIVVLLPLLALASAPMNVTGQVAPPSGVADPAENVLEVGDVKFGTVRASSGDTWMEVLVEVSARPGGKAAAGDFLDQVRVTLNLATEFGEGAVKKMNLYRASVEAVALEGGAKSVFRFYLPPEVVKRDRLTSGEAGKYFLIEFEVGGKPVASVVKGSFTAKFADPGMRRQFMSRITSDASRNDGVLVPQHLSPFATDAQRRAPSVIRREGGR